MDNLETILEGIRATLEAKNAAREALIAMSRLLIQHCGKAIRAMHRQEWEDAGAGLAAAHEVQGSMAREAAAHPELYAAGFVQDAFKEYVEASTTFALLRDKSLPTPGDLGVEAATYLNGVCEAASELRRDILDIIRHDHDRRAERLLAHMETIYDMLVTFDFPDAISGGLRHRVDSLRAVLERTRGDVTLSLRQQRLEAAISRADQPQDVKENR